MAADPRFHAAGPALSLSEAAAIAGGELRGGDPGARVAGVGPLDGAGPQEVSFLDNRRYAAQLAGTRAAAVVLSADFVEKLPAGVAAIVTAQPYLGFARIAARLHPRPSPRAGIHPTAVVDPDATVGPGCEIGAYAVVEAGAQVGAHCILSAHAYVGPGVVLGDGCRIGPHASITHALAGRGVVLHPGARVGQEGFGFAVTPDGRFETMPQLGRVVLGDGVEIGANSCVDRGSQGDTVIGAGTRLDNLVQVAHNVKTGQACVIVAQVGISGSATLGNGVVLGGQAGVTGHLTLGDRVRAGAQSGVMNDIPAGTDVVGSPAWPARETLRAVAALRKLGQKPARG
ncbi:UDP-3-O-(3-hydroxymyristoyl)glucosamine N-acyltransferase [Falsiroseomonas sp. HW251]|uniref:UDP-3-O-(3-hydroxymyristoyl)glucosamine N-acyltransferase n=1 Tax=Falsiroseomonas sp. HW251 TaxID=3390998 RepID=UPI003D31630D